MLRRLRLRNFRSLRDTGEVELRPIVVLVGANSSGKSSFLRFFPLLKQTARSTGSSPLLWYVDNSDVDFGDFNNSLFRGAAEPFIEISGEIHQGEQPIEFSSRIIGGADGRSHIQHFSFTRADDIVELTADEDGKLLALHVNDHPHHVGAQLAARAALPFIHFESDEVISYAYGQLTERLRSRLDSAHSDTVIRVLARHLVPGPNRRARLPSSIRRTEALQAELSTLAKDDALMRTLAELVVLRVLPDRLNYYADLLRTYARGVRYIGPFRRSPQRFYRRTELGIDELDRDGSNLAMFLDSLGKADREDFSTWLREHFGFGVHLERREQHVALMADTDSPRSFNVMDMGFGMSQLLPVVAQCWLSSKQPSPYDPPFHLHTGRPLLPGTAPTLLAVEQPELHLHPHHQARLADMFSSTTRAMGELDQPISLIIETHSEAMLYRFGELVESGALRREDISILFFEKKPGTDESTVRPIEFGPDGVLKDWPIGFFRG